MLRRIPAEVYDRAFFLSQHLEGYDEYLQGELSFVKARQLEMLGITPGMRVLEVGYGRGELLLHCARRGAEVAGVDYAGDAIGVARETLAEFPAANLHVADARDLPFADNSFDRVFSGDVIEHMCWEDGVAALGEMYRVTRPGGFLLVKTTPNTVFVRWIYPWGKWILRWLDKAGVQKLDEQLEVMRRLHVYEYNQLSYRRLAVTAGLPRPQVWIDPDLTRADQHRYSQAYCDSRLIRLVRRCGRFGIVRFFLGNDLYLKVVKPATALGHRQTPVGFPAAAVAAATEPLVAASPNPTDGTQSA
ncbi:MAG: class I SAM-dependent methyltransferase [Pirellulales bacterium]|nr:class I SAM-dependent methyltransferase [Pirellulales bacterium]